MNPNLKLILVNVSGPDHPGITARLMKILADKKVNIVDMGQAVTHGLLSLSFVMRFIDNETDHGVLKDLLFEAKKMNLALEFNDVTENAEINPAVPLEKFILSCVSMDNISGNFLLDLSQLLAKANINILRIDNIHPQHFKCLEVATVVPDSLDLKEIKLQLLNLSNRHKVDMAFLKDNIFRRSKRLIVFDMDSTLIQIEVIDQMAELLGVGTEVKAITERAMNGEMDFDESITKRVAKLKGLTCDQMDAILNNMPLHQGVEEFIKTVKNLGYKTALISGGFNYFAGHLKQKLSLDYAFANELEIVDGKLTGKIIGTIINANQKALLLKLIAQQENISLEQVVAIGDGANDLPMLSTAGLGIAFHAKEVVRKNAPQTMGHGPMTSILYFLGIPGPGAHQ
jgi:phosphoserine phosphatase